MLTPSRTSLCPSRFCSGRNPPQRLVSKREATLAKEPAIEDAILCSVCGCVWVRDPRGVGHVLGTLRRDGSSWRWISAYKVPNAKNG